MAKYFAKGRMSIATGRLQIRGWTDKEGNKRRTAEVIAESVYFGDSKNGSASAAKPATGYTPPASAYAPPGAPQPDYALLENDDTQLPF